MHGQVGLGLEKEAGMSQGRKAGHQCQTNQPKTWETSSHCGLQLPPDLEATRCQNRGLFLHASLCILQRCQGASYLAQLPTLMYFTLPSRSPKPKPLHTWSINTIPGQPWFEAFVPISCLDLEPLGYPQLQICLCLFILSVGCVTSDRLQFMWEISSNFTPQLQFINLSGQWWGLDGLPYSNISVLLFTLYSLYKSAWNKPVLSMSGLILGCL